MYAVSNTKPSDVPLYACLGNHASGNNGYSHILNTYYVQCAAATEHFIHNVKERMGAPHLHNTP